MVDLKQSVREVERITGATVVLSFEGVIAKIEALKGISIRDQELHKAFKWEFKPGITELAAIAIVEKLHNVLYKARGRKVYLEQGRKCVQCGSPLNGSYDINHKESRGAHGRNDRIANLEVIDRKCHTEFHSKGRKRCHQL